MTTDVAPTEAQTATRNAILNLLRNYGPFLSLSMISSHIASYGTQYNVNWKHELNALVESGAVKFEARRDTSNARTVVGYFLP